MNKFFLHISNEVEFIPDIAGDPSLCDLQFQMARVTAELKKGKWEASVRCRAEQS